MKRNTYREQHILDVWMLANKSLSAIERRRFINHPITRKLATFSFELVEISITVNQKVLLPEILEDVQDQSSIKFNEREESRSYSSGVCASCVYGLANSYCLCSKAA